jgi:hypothetical protein
VAILDDAVDLLRADGRTTFLDLTCGDGSLMLRMAEALRCESYGITDGGDSRARNVIKNCTVDIVRISRESFSLIHFYPPLNWQRRGGPGELEYLSRATNWLLPSGVVAAVVSPGVVRYNYTPFVVHLNSFY